MDLLVSFLTLSALEIVLGIDNLIFIALLCQGLPAEQRSKARLMGLSLALGMRILMLLGATWIMGLTKPVLEIAQLSLSFKDMLLIAGGLFLIGKATLEIHHDIEDIHGNQEVKKARSFKNAIIQILIIDFVFSFDSIITAVGLSNNLYIIIAAIVVSMVVMLVFSKHVTEFLVKFPTFKILALSFILMIGIMLLADGLGFHFPREYIYFAFAYSAFIEGINSIKRSKRKAKK